MPHMMPINKCDLSICKWLEQNGIEISKEELININDFDGNSLPVMLSVKNGFSSSLILLSDTVRDLVIKFTSFDLDPIFYMVDRTLLKSVSNLDNLEYEEAKHTELHAHVNKLFKMSGVLPEDLKSVIS